MKRVVILGGGSGGAAAARRLSRWSLPGEVEVVLIDRSPWHDYRPDYLWVMTGLREPDEARRPLSLLTPRYGTRVVQAAVTAIDPDARRVDTDSGGSFEYDYLIVALGAVVRDDPVSHGLEAPWELDFAMDARKRVAGFEGGRVVVSPMETHRCPPAPFEVAFMLRYLAEQRGVLDKTSLTVAYPAARPMQSFGPLMVAGFGGFLEQYGIAFEPDFHLAGNDREAKVLRSADGRELPYDFAMLVPPHEPPEPVRSSPLAADSGYMDVVLPSMASPRYPNAYGIGDVVAPTIGLGMAGVFAHLQAEHVVSRILDDVRGAYMGELYNMVGVCVMDAGYMGVGVWCDFTDKLAGRVTDPDCRMLGGMRVFRALKVAFEKYWFANVFGS